MNNTNLDLLWIAINFLWSGVLVLSSVWLFSISRQVENERRRYQHFIQRQEEKQRNERKL